MEFGAIATIILAVATVLAAAIQRKPKEQNEKDTRPAPPRKPEETAVGCAAYFRNEGDEYARLGNYSKALKKYRAATKREPFNALNHDKMAEILIMLGYYENALDENIKAVARATDTVKRAQYYTHRAETLERLGRTADALTDRREAARLDPDNAEYHHDLGRYLWQLHWNEEAVEEYKKAAELALNNAEYYHDFGYCLRQLRQYEEAVKAYQKAAEFAPNNEEYRAAIGDCLWKLEQYKEAAEAYQKAAVFAPNNAEYYHAIGNCLCRLGQNKEAVEAYQKAAELSPNTAEYHHELGFCLWQLNRYEEATEAYRKAAGLMPDDYLCLFHLSQAQDALRKSRAASP